MVKYVVPSYQRPNICKEQTLNFLKKHNVDDSDIYLVLRTDDPYVNDYVELFKKRYFDSGIITEIDPDLTEKEFSTETTIKIANGLKNNTRLKQMVSDLELKVDKLISEFEKYKEYNTVYKKKSLFESILDKIGF